MIVPAILPDELMHGYLMRLSSINGLKISDFLLYVNNQRKASKNNQEPSGFNDVISKIVCMPQTYLLKHHSLIHLLRHKNQLKKPTKLGYIYFNTPIFFKESNYFCRSCCKEDIEYHGYSYWRVTHQLHGLEFCLKHRELLIQVRRDRYFRTMPHVISSDDYISAVTVDARILKCSAALRFFELCEDFQTNEIYLNRDTLTAHLRALAKELRINTTKRNGRIELNEYLTKTYPMDWLCKYFYYWRNRENYFIGSTYMRCYLTREYNYIDIFNYLLVIAALDPDMNLRDYAI
ncbi:MAG: TniQ family protein [Methylophilus sp.]|uniref:TniQ family protein n=1 Tax=Methylophilus sp. TaxID=29541 RepID=UPI00403700BA